MTPSPAINQNRETLLRLVGALFALAGVVVGGTVAVLPRHVQLKVLRVLRAAESATRRLAVVEARGLTVSERAGSAFPVGGLPRGAGERLPAFRLIDPRKTFSTKPVRRFAKVGPQIRFFDDPNPVFEAVVEPSPDDAVGAARLCKRLHALHLALSDLPKQARRMARLYARQARSVNGRPRLAPLRPGWPPGYRQRHSHEVDGVLRDCHDLALYALKFPDTS